MLPKFNIQSNKKKFTVNTKTEVFMKAKCVEKQSSLSPYRAFIKNSDYYYQKVLRNNTTVFIVFFNDKLLDKIIIPKDIFYRMFKPYVKYHIFA